MAFMSLVLSVCGVTAIPTYNDERVRLHWTKTSVWTKAILLLTPTYSLPSTRNPFIIMDFPKFWPSVNAPLTFPQNEWALSIVYTMYLRLTPLKWVQQSNHSSDAQAWCERKIQTHSAKDALNEKFLSLRKRDIINITTAIKLNLNSTSSYADALVEECILNCTFIFQYFRISNVSILCAWTCLAHSIVVLFYTDQNYKKKGTYIFG